MIQNVNVLIVYAVDGEAAVAGDLSVTPEAKELNSQAVRATEDGRKDDALEAFERAIRISPNWAALYNNRAQLYRLMRKEQGVFILV